MKTESLLKTNPDEFKMLASLGSQIAAMTEAKDNSTRIVGMQLMDELRKYLNSEHPEMTRAFMEKMSKARDARNADMASRSAVALEMFHAEWTALHKRALTWKGGDDSEYLKELGNRLPNGSCQCRNHLEKYITENPPDFSAEDYFPWTVSLHNYVNKIKVPTSAQMELEEARALYQ